MIAAQPADGPWWKHRGSFGLCYSLICRIMVPMSAPTTTPVIYTREQAKEADRVLNELMFEVEKKKRNLTWAKEAVRRLVDRETGWGRQRAWGKTFEQALAEVQAQAATADPEKPWVQSKAQQELNDLAEAEAELETARAAQAAQEQLWYDHGMWPRYSVVPGGHIHTEFRECHTLRPTTTVLWAYQASGDSVDEAIEVYGTVLCTHCYPDAPVETTGGKTLTDGDGNVLTKAEAAAIAEAKAAEKAAKLAAKNAKAVFEPGTDKLLQGPDLRELKTEVAVVRQLIEAVADHSHTPNSVHFYGRKGGWVKQADGTSEYVEVVDPRYPTWSVWTAYALEALAAKRGVPVAEVKAEIDKKVRARNARNGR